MIAMRRLPVLNEGPWKSKWQWRYPRIPRNNRKLSTEFAQPTIDRARVLTGHRARQERGAVVQACCEIWGRMRRDQLFRPRRHSEDGTSNMLLLDVAKSRKCRLQLPDGVLSLESIDPAVNHSREEVCVLM